tara:strand:- start:798 stop:1091 length:294 start_codon:yes stop_codon:yes gene_type:complete
MMMRSPNEITENFAIPLTNKQLSNLIGSPDKKTHLRHFVLKWIHVAKPPSHILDILQRLSVLNEEQSKGYAVYQDELYVIPQQKELLRLKRKKSAKR